MKNARTILRTCIIHLKNQSRRSLSAASSSSSLPASEHHVKVVFANGIKTITMCHGKTRNSLSIAMMETLVKQLRSDWENPELRVLVVEGEGPVFSAGHNLKELSSQAGTDTHKRVFNLASTLMTTIIESPVPVIARIDGMAAAAGCQLVAQCDLAICSNESTFLTPGVNFGIFCSTPGVALARSVPKSTALKMLLTGKAISSAEALRFGLVAVACPRSDLDSELGTLCDDIKAKSRSVVELGKRFYYQQVQRDVLTAYKMAAQVMVDNLQMADGAEGVSSFLEKRQAKWTHSSNNNST